MPETIEICRSRAMSEEYRDFIFESKRPYFLNGISGAELCEQYVGYEYHVVYIDKMFADPMSLDRFTYGAIPKCYTLLDTEALNEAGISQIQNYPTLKLTGKGVMIGFIDTGIDYQNPIFRNLDGTTRIAGIWDQTIRRELLPRDLFTEQSIQRRRLTRRYKERILWKLFHPKMRTAMGHFLRVLRQEVKTLKIDLKELRRKPHLAL